MLDMLFHDLTGVRLASGLQRKWELAPCTHTGCEAMRPSEETTHSRRAVKYTGSPRYGASYWTLFSYRMIHHPADRGGETSASALQLACQCRCDRARNQGTGHGHRVLVRIPVGLSSPHSLHPLRLHFALRDIRSTFTPIQCGESPIETDNPEGNGEEGRGPRAEGRGKGQAENRNPRMGTRE